MKQPRITIEITHEKVALHQFAIDPFTQFDIPVNFFAFTLPTNVFEQSAFLEACDKLSATLKQCPGDRPTMKLLSPAVNLLSDEDDQDESTVWRLDSRQDVRRPLPKSSAICRLTGNQCVSGLNFSHLVGIQAENDGANN